MNESEDNDTDCTSSQWLRWRSRRSQDSKVLVLDRVSQGPPNASTDRLAPFVFSGVALPYRCGDFASLPRDLFSFL